MINKTKSLKEDVIRIIEEKGTECPFSGEFDNFDQEGTYLCRRCGLALFRSSSKFHSACGWPSFDQEIKGSIKQIADKDGIRTEILCNRCQAHLGHVFSNEGFTKLNTRYCVNSLALDFVKDLQVADTEEAIFAGGCFWGLEHLFRKLNGVIKTECGYIGGLLKNPSYAQVCTGTTGHFEAVRVVFDKEKTSFLDIAKYFFEIHDPTQINGQGPDIGEQYQSIAFYFDDEQKSILEKLIRKLETQGLKVATRLSEVSTFWPAEEYHQNYYQKNKKTPYCHFYTKRFNAL